MAHTKLVLMVAEKPALAASIATILSNDSKYYKRVNKKCTMCPVYEFYKDFPAIGENCKIKMTSVCGHVMALDFKAPFKNWKTTDPRELFSAQTVKKQSNTSYEMVDFLFEEGRGIDYLVLWLDCDKEGENICYEVINAVQMDDRPQFVYRAKFSAIMPKDIIYAYENLSRPNKNEAESVDARMELDLRIGCAFTRLQTTYFQEKYSDLDSTLVSYGPCQTPTLCFCVERMDEILSFTSELFWYLTLTVTCPPKRQLECSWSRGNLFDQDVVDAIYRKIKGETLATVLRVNTQEKRTLRPLALNTVKMLKCASERLSMSPQQTMEVAEKLYTRGYISYPRTETTHYSASYNFSAILNELSASPVWSAIVSQLCGNRHTPPRLGVDAGDHPPITPTRLVSEADLPNRESWKLYELIVRTFISSISSDCVYNEITISFTVLSEVFTATGKTYVQPGFFPILYNIQHLDDTTLPTLNIGDTCSCFVTQSEGQTKPPNYLTESELITLMESHCIGTDASIPVHINNITERNYVTVESGRVLKPTSLGLALIRGYKMIDHELCSPKMRAEVEKQLNLISRGEVDWNSIVKYGSRMFLKKYDYFFDNLNKMDELFEVSFTALSDSGKNFTKCGKCYRYMKYISTLPQRLHCSYCDETYSMPKIEGANQPQPLTDKCPLDNFELYLLIPDGISGSYVMICPYCYNYPPYDMYTVPHNRGGAHRPNATYMSCQLCPHPTCPHSLVKKCVSACSECDYGFITLQAARQQKKHKLQCNKCSLVINFGKIENVSISNSAPSCEKCGAAALTVDFGKEHILGTIRGCVFCHEELRKHIQYAPPQTSYVFAQKSRGGKHKMHSQGRGNSNSVRGRH